MKKNTIIFFVAGVIGVIGIGALTLDYHRSQAAQPDEQQQVSAEVVTQAVEQRSLANTISTFGDVLPARTLGVSSAYPAQITNLLVIQGQMVKKGSPLAVIASDPAARLVYEQAQSAAKLSRAELDRTRELLRLQLATQSQLDAAQKAFDDAQAALATQQNLGGVASATLRAPADGIVTALTVAQGDRIAAAAPIMQLGVVGSLKVLLGIDPSDRQRVKIGAAVTIAALADVAETLQGTVTDVQDAIDPKTQLSNVVVKIDGADRRFVPGMRVRADIAAEQRKAFAVQRQAVLNDEKGAYLFQVAQAKAHRVDVQTVIDNRGLLGVTGNIDPHAPVVVVGNYELQDGMAVREASR
jgi:membrane fusion protein (multidrug efflux system)